MRTVLLTAWAIAVLATTASAAARTLSPAALATIRNLPELGILEALPDGDAMQSSYFRTSTTNREFRRGIAEFSIPSAAILSATLVLVESRATIAAPVSPDIHEVISYTPADLAVTTADYDRVGAAVGTLSTDANLEQQTFRFDVTALAVAATGGTLGFRVQLDVDPAYSDLGTLGSAFAVTLETLTVPIAVPESGPHTLAIHGSTPNPVTDGRLRVEFTLRDGSPARLELLDVAGRALISRQLGTPGPGRHVLDLSNGRALAAGIYFLRLTQDGREVRARAAVLR